MKERLFEITVDEITGKSSREILLAYIRRIAAFDKKGSCLNSVLELNPDALFLAEFLDRQLKPLGPLHGAAVILKDNIDTKDKMHTSAGSLALADSYAKEDAFLVRRLREAGALILGKANMTEWANFISDRMPNGYSSRGGQVLNPYDPERFDVGGSSSGTAVAVSANFATVGVGTETSGSILNPSHHNSIVGLKPTVGLISRSGIIPIAHSQDTPGPMCRTVRDAAVLLGVMAGVDENDPATWVSEQHIEKDYTRFLDKDAFKGTKIGVARWAFDWLKPKSLPLMQNALEAMEDLGAHLVDLEPWTIPRPWIATLIYEFKGDINRYLGGLADNVPVHSLKELISFNREHSRRALRYGQALFEKAESTSGTLTEPEYIAGRLRDLRLTRDEGIDRAKAVQEVDAVFFPEVFGAGIAAKAGYPAITVPVGYTEDGKPKGVMFTAGAYEEPLLLGLAYALEQALMARRSPRLNP